MNTIKNVGDLAKALSAYPQELPLKVLVDNKTAVLNSDTQIYRLNYSEIIISCFSK